MDFRSPAHTLIDDREESFVDLVRTYLRQPGFSDTGEGIIESAQLTLEHLRSIGCQNARIVSTDGHPVVYGRLDSRRPGAKTLIVYGLYDLTPVVAAEWTVPPLAASVVSAQTMGLPAGIGDVIVSRGAHNHRGPTLTALMAIKALVDAEGDLPCHIIFVIEGEEEIGSPHLKGFIDAHRAELTTASAAWLPCMYEGPDKSMLVLRGFKGALWAELTCRGGEWGGTKDGRHLWAGHSVWIDSPLTQVIRATASLLDAEDRFALDGLDLLTVDLTEEDKADTVRAVAELNSDPAADVLMKQILGVRQLRHDRRSADYLEQFMFGVNMNVQGVVGGYDGPRYYSMLPGWGKARLDIRCPPGVSAASILLLMREHLDRRGLHHVEISNVNSYPAARTSRTDPILLAATAAAAQAGISTTTWPMYNGCCPASLFQHLSNGMGFSFAGLGQGERPHAPDEYIHADAIGKLAHFTVDYLKAWSVS